MKILITFIISLIPVNNIKIILYQFIFGFKISKKSKIGFCNVLLVNEFYCDQAFIGNFNYIKCESLTMKKGSLINKFNRLKNINKLKLDKKAIIFSRNFISGIRKNSENESMLFKNQNFSLGETSELLRGNYVDLTDEIKIGKNVVFGGNGSEFWTHGFDLKRNLIRGTITFENNIFVGSKCIFTKNINVGNNITIGPNSVIYKNINESGFYTSQQIVKVK